MEYEIIEYTTDADKNPFRDWFFSLNARAAAKITTAIVRLENGNTSNVKSVGGGVYEYKINLALDTESISPMMAKTSLSFWPEAQKSGNPKISKPLRPGGPITRPESRQIWHLHASLKKRFNCGSGKIPNTVRN
jgi:hypothetical protein